MRRLNKSHIQIKIISKLDLKLNAHQMTSQAKKLKSVLKHILPNQDISVRTDSWKCGKGREYGKAKSFIWGLSKDQERQLKNLLPEVAIDKICRPWIIEY